MEEAEAKRIKIVLIGDSATGKTSLITRFFDDTYQDTYQNLNVDFVRRVIEIDNQTVEVLAWDLPRSSSFRPITKYHYRCTKGILLVFDRTDLGSYNSIEYWLRDCRNKCTDAPIVLVSNKSDLTPHQDIPNSSTIADKYDLPIFHTSAKTGTNVNKAFIRLVKDALAYDSQSQESL